MECLNVAYIADPEEALIRPGNRVVRAPCGSSLKVADLRPDPSNACRVYLVFHKSVVSSLVLLDVFFVSVRVWYLIEAWFLSRNTI